MYDYTYDDGGNLTSKTHTIAGTQDYTASYTYDSNMTDLLTGYTKTSSDGTVTTQTYDYTAANGNLYVNPTTITKSTNGTVTDTLSLTWREGRQLSAITTSAGTVKYEYNEDGLRTYRELANGAKRYYYYNGSQLEYIKILNASGALTSTIRYIYNSNGQAEYIMYIKSGNAANPKVYDLYYVLRNNSGVITKLIKVRKATSTSVTPTLEVAVEYTYDPYGKLLSTNIVNGDAVGTYNPLVYKDYIYDSETGLYYVSSRYYDPEIGRFINADSQLNQKDGILGYNMFAYCHNNPIMYSDPTGHSITSKTSKTGDGSVSCSGSLDQNDTDSLSMGAITVTAYTLGWEYEHVDLSIFDLGRAELGLVHEENTLYAAAMVTAWEPSISVNAFGGTFTGKTGDGSVS